MIRGNRVFAGFVLALLVVGALSGAAAFAEEEVVDESGQQAEASAEDAGLPLLEDAVEEADTPAPAEEPAETEPGDDLGDAASGNGEREPRPRPVRSPHSGGGTAVATASSSDQPEPDGQGTIDIDPESAAGDCPGGTAFKIDNLRSNGTFGPITISDFTNTSFTWTSTEAVSAVLVKDGGGVNTNPGGSSGSASSLGQDISHVIFCLGGDVPEVDAETPEEVDAEEPCDGDETMPGTQPCEPEPCDADETMPGTQPCVPAVCDADETMPGRQDCAEDVAGVQSDQEKPVVDDDVQGAGLAADRAPVAPTAAQPMAQGTVLPFTGTPLGAFVMIAFGLVTAGGGAVLIKRP